MTRERPGLAVLGFCAATLLSAQTVREKVAVEVITVRLTARDASGKRVEDLKGSDLTLTVDGKPVVIETFSGPEAPPTEAGAAATIPAAASATVAAIPGTSAPPRSPDGLPQRVLIFVDEVQTHTFDRKVVCAELARYVSAPVPADREFRVARFDGKLQMETGWTRDGAAVAAVLQRIGTGGKLERVASPGEVGSLSGDLAWSSPAWIRLHADRVHEALLEALAAFPQETKGGRLLYVTGGTTSIRNEDLAFELAHSNVSPDLAEVRKEHTQQLISDTLGNGRNQEMARSSFVLWSRAVNPNGHVLTIGDLVAKAVERDIELVPVVAESADRGDMDVSSRQEALGTSPAQTGMNVPTAGDGRLTPHLNAAAAMAGVAQETGGELVGVGGSAAARLSEIDSRAMYALSFRDPYGDNLYHPIVLKSSRRGVTIEYRRGYSIPQEDERTLDTVVAGFLEPDRGANPMSASIVQTAATDSKQRPATKLALIYAPPLETGAPDERPISMVAVGQDRNGNHTEAVEWSGTARRAEGETFQATILLTVAPGYDWSVAVQDQPTGLTSYVLVPPPRP